MLGTTTPSEYAKRLEPIEFYGKKLEVEAVEARLKNGYASIRNGKVMIRVPQKCSRKRKLMIIDELYGKISNAIRKKPGSFLGNSPLEFRDGEVIAPLSERLAISVREYGLVHSRVAIRNGMILVKLGRNGSSNVSDLVSSALAKHYKSYVDSYVREWNRRFGSELGRISISRGLTIWGSCSPKNNISINLRLLFLDKKFLDYVVVHELSHTKVRSHSKRFWKTVAKYLPEYRLLRKELKTAGARIDTEFKEIPSSQSIIENEKETKKSAAETAPTEEKKNEIAQASGQRNMLDYFG